eukprot:GEMP01069472.1.p1 GENE.GEMP01069472.1~~GEMP01069472.1.p1  ORF type:complete len:201 (+),score=32.96 GEMP01069472.1:77-679(+)
MSSSRASATAQDYEEQGKKLLATIEQRRSSVRKVCQYNDLDCVHEHPVGKGKVYIGNITSAKSKEILNKNEIQCVVNCQDPKSPNYFEGTLGFHYFRFPIAFWWSAEDNDTDAGLIKFFAPFFGFVDKHISEGRNVLIHCLAGAHRAGTSGVAYTMYAKKLTFDDALTHCKSVRPIIDPFGQLGDLLQKLQRALQHIDNR